MANRHKSYESYLIDSGPVSQAQADEKRPAVALLYEVIEISDAIRHCVNKFPTKQSGDLTKASRDSIWALSAAVHASLMSHFETFQKSMFAGLFEVSRLNDDFDMRAFSKMLSDSNVDIQIDRLQNYRGEATSVGLVLADSLGGWHSPHRVNSYFKGFVPTNNFFSSDDVADLSVLWQLRHSIVHTGGRLTRGDSHKVPQLTSYADRALTIDNTFVDAVCRRFHSMVKRTVGGLETEFRKGLTSNLLADDILEVDALFTVTCSRPAWLT